MSMNSQLIAARLAARRGTALPVNIQSELDEVVEIVCPHCGVDLELDPETGDVITKEGDAAAPARPVATNRKHEIKNELFSITCPSCGGLFHVDTTIDDPVIAAPSEPKDHAAALAKRRGTPAPRQAMTTQKPARVTAVRKGSYSSARAEANFASLAARRKQAD